MSVTLRTGTGGLQRVRRESEMVWSDIAVREPAYGLREQVRGYVGYEERTSAERSLLELPSGDVVLMSALARR